jgi:ribosome biogenesis protein Nip4
MAELIKNFVKRFDAQISLDWGLVARKGNKFFYLPQNLKSLVEKNRRYYYVGLPLGKVKHGKFFPSFPLLFMTVEKAKNRIVVDDKAAWLFICGRDIFKEGVMQVEGSREKGSYTLIFNKHGECLGFGRIRQNLDKVKKGVAVENVLDIGDFLRREKHQRLNAAQF